MDLHLASPFQFNEWQIKFVPVFEDSQHNVMLGFWNSSTYSKGAFETKLICFRSLYFHLHISMQKMYILFRTLHSYPVILLLLINSHNLTTSWTVQIIAITSALSCLVIIHIHSTFLSTIFVGFILWTKWNEMLVMFMLLIAVVFFWWCSFIQIRIDKMKTLEKNKII